MPVTRTRVTAANGEAQIVAEMLQKPEPSRSVVLLPSFARGAADFTAEFGSDLAERIAAAGYRAILPWPRGFGHGLSTGELEALTLEQLAGDVAAVIEAHARPPVAVLGHAFGQRVARMLATVRPDLVERLILVAAGGAAPIPAAALQALVTLGLSSASTTAERIEALKVAFFAPGNDPAVWLEGWDCRLGLAQARANRPELVEKWWAGGGVVPMYVLQGALDTTAPAEDSSEVLLRDFPDRVEVVTIPNAGHAILPEQPARVASAVLDFLGLHGSTSNRIH